MKKQRDFKFGKNLKLDGSSEKTGLEKNHTNEIDEDLKGSGSDVEEYEGLDTSFLQDIMKDDEKFMDMLIKTNDKSVHEIQAGNLKESLSSLEKLEKILEYAAINKKILDRNLVIVCLYNIACNHQALWVLDKCSKYIDGVIYNLNQSIKQDDLLLKESIANKLDINQRFALRAIKLRKLQFLLKVYLQHCAVLSQLSKHDQALNFAKKSQKTMTSIIAECADCCREAQKKIESPLGLQNHPSLQEDNKNPESVPRSSSALNSKRNLDSGTIFRDEVSYLKNILEYAVPFVNDIIETTGNFSTQKDQDLLKQTRKSLFNWKNNPENNEKYLRKEFGKSKLPHELKDGDRSLLGVQRPTEWLENLNIGTIMHMKPIKYKDYAQKKEFTNEITKDALQEKVIFQSLIHFTIATEMRFLEMTDESLMKSGENKISQEEIRNRERYKNSEVYHLKAIELVCRYVNKPCPYINHLISSYQKHYNQDLETIPEESYYSTSEGATTHEASREYERRSLIPLIKIDEVIQKTNTRPAKIESDTEKMNEKNKPELNLLNKEKEKDKEKEKEKEKAESPLQTNRKRGSDQNKEEKPSLQAKQKESDKVNSKREPEEVKKKKDTSEGENKTKKLTNVKSKRKLTEEDEAKNVYIANLAGGSLGLDNLLSHNLSPSKPTNTNLAAYKDNGRLQDREEEEVSGSKYFVKRNFDSPNSHEKISEGIKTQVILDRNSLDQGSGFLSERNIKSAHGKRTDYRSTSPQKVIMDQNDPAINLFFYKNFNKFIQNLYVQNEQDTKVLRVETKKESKFANNPYSKEIAAVNASIKKSSQNKRNTPIQSAKLRQSQASPQGGFKNCSLSFGKANQKEDEWRTKIDVSGQARTERDILKVAADERDFKSKLSSKFAKSISYKAAANLDLMKTKSKDRSKHISPRD